MHSRLDYLKLSSTDMRGNVDRSQAVLAILERPINGRTLNVKMHIQVRAGTVVSFYELWGEDADLCLFVYGDELAHLPLECHRLDLKGDFVGPVDLRVLGEQMHASTKLNYVTYNSRLRLKTDTRDGGGYGFAFGSMKSRFRFSGYQRGNEKSSMEVQIRLKDAARIWQEAKHEWTAGGEPVPFYTVLIADLFYHRAAMLSHHFGEDILILLTEMEFGKKQMASTEPNPMVEGQAPLPYTL